MRDYNRVSPRFWPEAQAGGWSEDMKVLGLYLLTCEHRTTEGLYRLPVEYMAADLSGADQLGCDLAGAWSAERVRQALAQLSADGFVKYDYAARVVFLPRALVYQAPENPNQRKAAIKSLLGLPRTPLLGDFLEAAQSHCAELAKELREQLAEPSCEGIGESPAPALAPTPTPTPKELVAAASAATASSSEEAEAEEQTAKFADYWAAYPRKVGESEARKRWGRLSDANRIAAVAAAGHVAEYAASAGVDLLYIPYPGTFIGPKRTFEDWAQGLPAGYAAGAAPNADSGPILCLTCQQEVTPDDFFDATYIENRGWVHEACHQRRAT